MLRTLTTLACLVPALALGQEMGPPLRGKTLVVNNGPGDQTDPHVSGALVAYTHQSSLSSSEIRYHDLLTGLDQAVPSQGAHDSLADISGDTIVLTRSTDATRVYGFNVREGGAAQELAPRSGADRRAATIGGQTVAWQELGYTTGSQPPEIFAYRLDTLALTRLTEDSHADRTPAVSADGKVVAWTKCATSSSGCDIWAARAVQGGYEVSQLTGTEGEESQPDTNGEIVAYVTRRIVGGVAEADIAWRPVGGGEARLLALPGVDANPSVSGPIIAFERREPSSTSSANFDIMLYDLRTETFYRVTETPESETLSDISMAADGLVRVVWTVRQNGDQNVYAYMFRIPTDCVPTQTLEDPATVCASPGARPLLGSLLVSRSSEEEEEGVSTSVEGRGTGVLCVDNGFEGTPATEGGVWLGAGLLVGPESFGTDVAGVAQAVPLQGKSTLSAQVGGVPGSAFRVRLYGEPSCDVGMDGDPLQDGVLRAGVRVPSERQGGETKGAPSHSFVPSGYEGVLATPGGAPGKEEPKPVAPKQVAPPLSEADGRVSPLPAAGCSAGGVPVSLLGVWMFAAAIALRARRGR